MGDFDPTWEHGHQTRDGRKARVICTDAAGLYPIVALISNPDGIDRANHYRADGTWDDEGRLDLINVPAPASKAWLSWYNSPNGPRVALCNDAASARHIPLSFALQEVEIPEGSDAPQQKPRQTVSLNLYTRHPKSSGLYSLVAYDDRDQAEKHAGPARYACIEIEIPEEGTGL